MTHLVTILSIFLPSKMMDFCQKYLLLFLDFLCYCIVANCALNVKAAQHMPNIRQLLKDFPVTSSYLLLSIAHKIHIRVDD